MDEIDYNAEFAAILGKAPAQPPSPELVDAVAERVLHEIGRRLSEGTSRVRARRRRRASTTTPPARSREGSRVRSDEEEDN